MNKDKKKIDIEVKGFGKLTINSKTRLKEIVGLVCKGNDKNYLGAIVDNEVKNLDFEIFSNAKIELLDITYKDGLRIYERTLSFIFIKACKDLFEECKVTIEHSLSKGIYTEIHNLESITLEGIDRIRNRMDEIIKEDLPINRKLVPTSESIKIFTEQKMFNKVKLLSQSQKEFKHLYTLDGLYDTFYGYLAPSTGYIKEFDLRHYHPGIIIQFPRKEEGFKIPEFEEQSKLAKIFKEAEEWGDILDVGYVSSLNEKIDNDEFNEIIRISEALHEKKIAYIADTICEDKDKRVILIAGPSSSGKTTFAQRLAIQLKVNGIKPISISLDNYFVNREDTPLDEEGKYDFESIEAIDIESFNGDLIQLLQGEEVELPTFNFYTGKREYNGKKIKVDGKHPIIIEGIHGLNEKLTFSIPKQNKFKIYISALTQLNIDCHNRIHTTDTRLIRRMVRDVNFRGNEPVRTLELWDSVRRGEEKNIFPYQEEADVMFNSALVYELAVLRKHVEPLLIGIDKSNEFYAEGKRLLKFIGYFRNIDCEGGIPCTSIIREFVGGSCFTEE